MDWNSLGHILTGVLAVTTIIATALVGLMFGSIKTLRDTANDLRDRVGDLEKDRTEKDAQIAKLTAENATLRNVVTGEVHWTALTDQLSHHHEQAERHWRRQGDLLEAILTSRDKP